MLFYAFRGFERVRFMISNLLVCSGGAPGTSGVNRTRLRPILEFGAATEASSFCCNRTCAWAVAGERIADATFCSQKRKGRRCEGHRRISGRAKAVLRLHMRSLARRGNLAPARNFSQVRLHLRRCENHRRQNLHLSRELHILSPFSPFLGDLELFGRRFQLATLR